MDGMAKMSADRNASASWVGVLLPGKANISQAEQPGFQG
jgi:hypothetical protein